MYDDDPPFFDPDELPRIIGRADAVRRGMSRHSVDRRVASGRWRRVLPRTYLTADTLTNRDRLNAALVFAGRGAALSGAAALWSSGVKRVAFPARVLVLVPSSSCVASTEWAQIRRTSRSIVATPAPGPRRVEDARATVDLAVTMRRLDDVRALVARVVQDAHCSIEDLGVELAAGPRRGSAHLRRALEEVGYGAASAPEARAAHILRRAGITGFVQNATIHLPDGSMRVADFYWPRLRAILEIDSVEFHFDRGDWSATWDRHLDLSAFGHSVIHRPPSALRDEARFVRDVRAWLAGREADLRRGLGS